MKGKKSRMKKPENKMKKIFIVIFFFLYMAANANNDISVFIKKTEDLKNDILKKEKKLEKLKSRYNFFLTKIEKTKNEKNDTKLNNFLNKLKLNYYLFRGNKIAFKLSDLKKQIEETKGDYFTYIILIVEEYNKILIDCMNTNCEKEKLEKNYSDRKKWVELIKNYDEILQIEDIRTDSIEISDEQAKNDFKDFLNKKIIQIEQVGLILTEEKNMRKKLIEKKIETDKKELLVIEKKLEKLKNKKEEIQKFLNKIKN